MLIARIFPRPCGARKNTTQLAKYPHVLYAKPSNKVCVKISIAFVRETYTLSETFICGKMNSCRSLYPRASNFHVLVSRRVHRPRFIFRTILARNQNFFNLSNQVRKNYGPENGNDLNFSFFVYYGSKGLIDAAELSFPREKVHY